MDKVFKLIYEIKEELKNKASNGKIDELLEESRKKDKKIEILESKVAVLSNSVDLLSQRAENREQYSQRHCLRIKGIPLPAGNETTDECLADIQGCFADVGFTIPDIAIDCCHRIGRCTDKKKQDKNPQDKNP